MSAGAWWESLYDDLTAEVFLGADPAELVATTTFLIDKLALTPGNLVLDQCCGVGTVALALAGRGLRVVGVEQSEPYVRQARDEARRRGLDGCSFHAGDAFAFVPSEPCDASFNWRTGFGNAEEDAANLRMLARAF